jgi:glycosyltransferase involved in cell wall biosynthesis
MKILYIVPNINNEGGVARVLSIKANYLLEKLGCEVLILTQNNGDSALFYDFNPKIELHDIILKGNKIAFFFQYVKKLNQKINLIKPDIIIVCDNGLKAFTIPFVLKTKIPIIFESHGSKFIEEKQKNKFHFLAKVKLLFKDYSANKFAKFVALSNESLKEWNVINGIIIPNPLWFKTNQFSDLKAKKVIAVSRHSHEKGLERLLLIWKKVVEKHPDWTLDIYGKYSENLGLQKIAQSLNISKNVVFYEPVKNINDKYLEASFYVMTSYYEGFPMVLIEAMASGLPCIAYDCPCGPRAIINNNQNGFLVENENLDTFVQKIELLIEDENLRIQMGKKAQKNSEKYDLEFIMQQWKLLFESFV